MQINKLRECHHGGAPHKLWPEPAKRNYSDCNLKEDRDQNLENIKPYKVYMQTLFLSCSLVDKSRLLALSTNQGW